MRSLFPLLLVPLAAILTACPSDEAADELAISPAPPDSFRVAAAAGAERVPLVPIHGSTVHRTATLAPVDKGSQIVLAVEDAPPNATLPAALHAGECTNPVGPIDSLAPVRTDPLGRGQSETRIDRPLPGVLSGQRFVSVGGPERVEFTVPVACGDLPREPTAPVLPR